MWSDAPLCVYDELKSDLGEAVLSLTTKTAQARVEFVNDCISEATDEIRTTKIMVLLPDIYAHSSPVYSDYSAWINSSGHTYDDLDSVADLITNPTVLNRSCRALAASKIYSRIVAHEQAQYGQDAQVQGYRDERDYWEVKYKDYFRAEWQLLKLDLDEDGETTEYERPRTRNSFLRV